MELHERPYGDVVVVDIRGPARRESGLTDIDSVILGAITQAHTTALRSGVALKLLNATARMRDLLRITKLDRFIAIADSEQKELGG